MRKWFSVLLFSSLLCSLAAPEAKAANDVLHFDLGTDWKVARRYLKHKLLIVEYVRVGDDPNNWAELFTIENSDLNFGQHSPDKYLESVKALREKECPGITQWNVIEQTEDSMTYEWQAKPCLGWRDQHEIARILYSKHNVFVLRYTLKTIEIPPETRTKWIKMFKDVAVDSDANSVNTSSGNVDATVPAAMDKVVGALKSAMASVDCSVNDEKLGRLECKRPRGYDSSAHSGYGGESVTAVLEAQGEDKTHVIITTGMGFYGRLGKKNWSTLIYQRMTENLEDSQPKP